jgi:hypothetical protein
MEASPSRRRCQRSFVPEMSYDGLEIGDGGTAVVRFAKVAMGLFSVAQAKAVREDLLRYCG